VKAIELSGESPDLGRRYLPVAEGNCVFNRKGGDVYKGVRPLCCRSRRVIVLV
jgi:hypothetical protein